MYVVVLVKTCPEEAAFAVGSASVCGHFLITGHYSKRTGNILQSNQYWGRGGRGGSN